MNNFARKLTGNTIQYLGKLVLTLCLVICLFIPTAAFALDYNSEAKNYLTNVQNDLTSIKTIIQQLPNTSLENGQENLVEIESKLDTIESNSKQKANLFKDFSNNYQVSYEGKLMSINEFYDFQKRYKEMYYATDPADWQRRRLLSFAVKNINEKINEYEEESRDLSKIIVLTDKVSVLASNLEKRVNLAKQKTNNVKEYAKALESFSDPDILGEIKDLDQYIGELTQNLPL